MQGTFGLADFSALWQITIAMHIYYYANKLFKVAQDHCIYSKGNLHWQNFFGTGI